MNLHEAKKISLVSNVFLKKYISGSFSIPIYTHIALFMTEHIIIVMQVIIKS